MAAPVTPPPPNGDREGIFPGAMRALLSPSRVTGRRRGVITSIVRVALDVKFPFRNINWSCCDYKACSVTLQRVALRLPVCLSAIGPYGSTGSAKLPAGRGIQAMPAPCLVAMPGVAARSGQLDPLARASRGWPHCDFPSLSRVH